MAISKYNMAVIENNFKSLNVAEIKFKVIKEISEIDMVWEVVFGGIKKLIFIHEGKAVAELGI